MDDDRFRELEDHGRHRLGTPERALPHGANVRIVLDRRNAAFRTAIFMASRADIKSEGKRQTKRARHRMARSKGLKEASMTIPNPALSTVVVYHSGYGHTRRMAEAVAQGAGAALFAIDEDGTLSDDGWAALDVADAIIFGSPTYMGGPSWQFKKFADASSKPWFADRWRDKVFGGFTNSASINGDKLNTLEYFVLLAGQHGGLWVSLAIKPANVKASRRNDPNRMGSYIAPMAQSDADAAPSEMAEGDLETARLYGARVAQVARQFASGRAA